MNESSIPSTRWLYGPIPDLFLGCGLLYVLACLLFVVDGGAVFRVIPLAVPVLLIALVSAPHYGATLLRVYDRREDRRGYFLFSVVATLLLLAVAGVALFDRFTGSVLATVYLTWASWHYTGQNYGIAAMFLRRRGVEVDETTRRLLHLSFVFSFFVVFLVMHGQVESLADPRVEVRLIPLAIPDSVNDFAVPAVVAIYLATTVGWIGLSLRRAQSLVDLVPTLLISLTQALWWSIPYAARHFEVADGLVPVGWDSRSLFFMWIACAHAIQYLWISSFYARSSSGWTGQLRYYALVLTAGSAIWALPALAFAPGRTSFDWNFALLLAATVNIHHFILDGAIWKLRHMKIARVLLSDASPAAASEERSVQRILLRRLVWGIAIVGLLVTIHSLAERFVIEPAARRSGDFAGVASSLDRQSWLGKTDAFTRFKLGRQFEAAGEIDAALAQFEISADMEPRVESIRRLIGYHQQQGHVVAFVQSCDRLFELDSVERTMPTPDLGVMQSRVPEVFRLACLRAARAARPGPSSGARTLGGGSRDGGIARGGGYE